jgi:hypothetical protein
VDRKKTVEAIQEEVACEIEALLKVAFTSLRKIGTMDLEAVEGATRAAVHRAGASVLAHLLDEQEPFPTALPCSCGHNAPFHAMRSRQLLTAVGPVTFDRAYYYCPRCHQGQVPRDRELDIVDTEYSPAVRRMMAVVGSDTSFHHGRDQLELLAGLTVTRKAVERHAEEIGADIARCQQAEMQRAVQLPLPRLTAPEIPVLYIEMDGTGVPVVSAETEGRCGKNPNEPAHTREVKLGCVFTQTGLDDQGHPVRDEASTTYTGAIESAETFSRRMYTEALQSGWDHAKVKVILGDGAVWIWNIADREFPGAVQIVDLYHAREHLWGLASKLFPTDERHKKRWANQLQNKLDKGKIESLVHQLRSLPAANPEAAELVRTEADYFERNRERMRYPSFRSRNLFVGSGVIEAACRTVIAKRLKQSGMFWTVRGANAIIALRCTRLSRRFEDYWASRSKAA